MVRDKMRVVKDTTANTYSMFATNLFLPCLLSFIYSLDNAETQTHDDNQHAGQCALSTWNKFSHEFSMLHWITSVCNCLILSIEERLLEHAQQNDATNPKLYAQQIAPLCKRDEQPNDAKDHIYYAHYQIELQKKKVLKLNMRKKY